MSYRCISAFEFAGVIYPGGILIEDGDPIVTSHEAFFARVNDSHAATQTATAAPGEKRDVSQSAPAYVPAAKKSAARKPSVKSAHTPEEGT